MKIFELLVSLVGYIAWPIAAIIIGFKLLHEIRDGLIAKVVQPGGSIEYAGVKLKVSEQIEKAHAEVQAAGLESQDANTLTIDSVFYEEDYTPYDMVMETWAELADAVTALAIKHGGKDDRRRVWENIKRLEQAAVIDSAKADATRSIQSARNSIRRTGEVGIKGATDFAASANALTEYFAKLA